MNQQNKVRSLERQIANIKDSLIEIQERKSQYVMENDIPLDLVRQEKRHTNQLQELYSQLNKSRKKQQGAGFDGIRSPNTPSSLSPKRTEEDSTAKDITPLRNSPNLGKEQSITNWRFSVAVFGLATVLLVMFISYSFIGGDKIDVAKVCAGPSTEVQCVTLVGDESRNVFNSTLVITLRDQGQYEGSDVRVSIMGPQIAALPDRKILSGSCIIAEPYTVDVIVLDPVEVPLVGNKQQATFIVRKMPSDYNRDTCKVIYKD